MNIFDIYIAYVSWGDGGKRRPVLILEKRDDSITVFNITTQYKEKSKEIRFKYYKINEWQQAGLDKESYIDTNKTVTLPLSSVDLANPIGTLTEPDVQGFIEFLSI